MCLEHTQLLARVLEFNATARAWWGRQPEGRAVPRVTYLQAALDKFLRPVRDAIRLWGLLNAGAAPSGVVLPLRLGPQLDFARADLEALMASALAAREAAEVAELLLAIARARRDKVEDRARAALAAFLKAAPSRLGADHPTVQAMPRLYPPAGHTPEPVKSAGAWDPDSEGARLTWEASPDKRLSHYEIRWCRGEDYSKKKERVAGRVEPDAPRVFLTVTGLAKRGAVACFRVYVVLDTKNERAGSVLTVRRPEAGSAPE